MTNEQVEKLLTDAVASLDKFGDKFIVAIGTTATMEKEKWYTPRQMFLRCLRCAVAAGPVEVKVLCAALHGAIDCLGFSGTLKAVLELKRRNSGNRKTKKVVVPGVRNGSDLKP